MRSRYLWEKFKRRSLSLPLVNYMRPMFSNKCLSLLVLLFPAAIVTLSAQPFAPNTSASERPVTSRDLVFNPALKPFYHGVASGGDHHLVVVVGRYAVDRDGREVVPLHDVRPDPQDGVPADDVPCLEESW